MGFGRLRSGGDELKFAVLSVINDDGYVFPHRCTQRRSHQTQHPRKQRRSLSMSSSATKVSLLLFTPQLISPLLTALGSWADEMDSLPNARTSLQCPLLLITTLIALHSRSPQRRRQLTIPKKRRLSRLSSSVSLAPSLPTA